MVQELKVDSVAVGELLDKLRSREWMIPAFQRDFVWTIGDVSAFVSSILERRPIGMVTLWQQSDSFEFPLEPVSIRDRDGRTALAEMGTPSTTRYAVLDGRQRCTAVAIAFGGLRPNDGRLKFRGRFFLNLTEENEERRIEFLLERDVQKRGLESDAAAVGQGLFPLSSSLPEESLMQQWYRYTQAIRDPSNYPNSSLPSDDDLNHRNEILARSFEGLMATRLAVNTVPSSYSLSEICEIFEVLNTTGTRVSTVDLIHSWLFSETHTDEDPILLRDWIDKIGERQGAVGWSSSLDRPELIAQMSTAAYASLASRPDRREIGRSSNGRIESVKAGDLLATPTLHWKNVIENEAFLVEALEDFQQCVAGGCFGWKSCPYPVTASIYVGLRWHHKFDVGRTHPWEVSDLDALFRGFFWRNALSSRYDQGFLTQLGADIRELKHILNKRPSYGGFDEWASNANSELDSFMNKHIPGSDELCELYTGRQTGALQKALVLPIVARAKTDLLRPELDISYPARTDIQLHHIYPQSWCRNNCTGVLSKYLDRDESDRDWIGSAANLMPLSRESNLEWRASNPSAIIHSKNLHYGAKKDQFLDVYVSKVAFDQLAKGGDGIPHFWELRAQTLTSNIENLVNVSSIT